jgi:hypothetical protein
MYPPQAQLGTQRVRVPVTRGALPRGLAP